MIHINLLIIFLLFHISWSLDEDLIDKFFQAKLCTSGTILHCNSKHDTIDLFKNLTMRGFRISTFNVARNFSTEIALSKGDANLAVIVDSDCINVETILKEATKYKYFFETYRWLIFGSNYDETMKKMQNVPLEINVDVTAAIPSTDSEKISEWIIYDLYNPSFTHGGKFKVEKIGFYDIDNKKYNVNVNGPKYYKRRNMTGTLMQSAMVVPEEISISLEEYLASDKDRFNNTLTRAHSVTVENCQAFYNFSNNISLLHSWGYPLPNGDVDGMLKELKEERIDFGNAALMYRPYRVKLVDYGHGNWIFRAVFIFRHPKSTLSSSEIYLRPLVDSVWYTTLGFIALLIIILRIIIKKQTSVLNSNPEDADYGDWSFLFLYGIGEMSQQGFALIPTLISGKMVTFTVLLFSFLIYQFYSASIVSLLIREPPHTIKTLKDLLTSSLEAGCEDSLFHRDYLKTTTDPVAIQLYNTKIKQPHNNSNFVLADVGLKKVLEGDYAFHSQTSTAYPIIESTFPEKAICRLTEIQMYPNEYIYMIIQKRSPFRELFNYCMYHQMEVGVIKRLRLFWTAQRPVCLDPTNYLEISVGIKESYWGLVILAFGFVASLLLLAIEVLWVTEKSFLRKKLLKI